jgi:hypothetical protein
VSTPTNVLKIVDEEGNKIISTHHGTFATIHLHLKEENFQRKIGVILIPEREFHVKRDRTKHFMHRTRQYGFNHYILDNAKLFDTVVIEDEHARWRIPRTTMLEHGKFMHFKNNGGFELQVFVSLDTLAPYEIAKSI